MTHRSLRGQVVEIARIALTVVVGWGLGVQTALPQAANSVTVEVGDCVNLPSPEERFACYERQVEAARTAPPPAPNTPAPNADDAATTTGNDAPEPQEIVATIVTVQQTVPNRYVITLDNGQIWRQTYAERYPIRPGLKVKLRPSRWGGTFSLTAEEHGGFIQVERVR